MKNQFSILMCSIIICIVVFGSLKTNAQESVYIGVPEFTYFILESDSNTTNQVFATELQYHAHELGNTPITIQSVAFMLGTRLQGTTGDVIKGVSIYMRNVPLADSLVPWTPVANLNDYTLVRNNKDWAIPNVTINYRDYYNLLLDVPFVYNGTGHLNIILIRDTAAANRDCSNFSYYHYMANGIPNTSSRWVQTVYVPAHNPNAPALSVAAAYTSSQWRPVVCFNRSLTIEGVIPYTTVSKSLNSKTIYCMTTEPPDARNSFGSTSTDTATITKGIIFHPQVYTNALYSPAEMGKATLGDMPRQITKMKYYIERREGTLGEQTAPLTIWLRNNTATSLDMGTTQPPNTYMNTYTDIYGQGFVKVFEGTLPMNRNYGLFEIEFNTNNEFIYDGTSQLEVLTYSYNDVSTFYNNVSTSYNVSTNSTVENRYSFYGFHTEVSEQRMAIGLNAGTNVTNWNVDDAFAKYCVQFSYNIPPNMQYVAAIVDEAQPNKVEANEFNLMSANIITTGGSNPLTVDNFVVDFTGTSADIKIHRLKVYSTGMVDNFNPNRLIAELDNPTISAAVTIPITQTLTLSFGNNYFWIVAEIDNIATLCGEILQAKLNSTKLSNVVYNDFEAILPEITMRYDYNCGVSVSPEFTVTIEPIDQTSPTSVVDIISSELKVFPNPASNYISFEFETLQEVSYTIEVVDLNGRILFVSSGISYPSALNAVRIDDLKRYGLANGTYFVNLVIAGKSTSMSFIIAN